MILRPITNSSLKSKKSKWYSCRSLEIKKRWGMHLNVVILKLMSNESELAKKICTSKIHDVDIPMYTLFTKFHS